MSEAVVTDRANGSGGGSGNPMGRPPGLRNKLTLLREKFAEARAEDILNMLVGHAFNHPAAAIFLAKRLFPAKDWAGATAAPGTSRLQSVADCDAMMEELLDAYCEGSISLEQFDRLSSLVSQRRDKQTARGSSGTPIRSHAVMGGPMTADLLSERL